MNRQVCSLIIFYLFFTISIVAEERPSLSGANVCTVLKNVTKTNIGRNSKGSYDFNTIQAEQQVEECCEGYQESANHTTCEPLVLLANDTNWFIGFLIVGVLALGLVSLLFVFVYRHKVAAKKAQKDHTVKYTVDSAEGSDDEDAETNNRVFRPDFVTPSSLQFDHDLEKPQPQSKSSAKTNEYVELGAEGSAARPNDYETIPPTVRQSHPASFENPNSSTRLLLNDAKEK